MDEREEQEGERREGGLEGGEEEGLEDGLRREGGGVEAAGQWGRDGAGAEAGFVELEAEGVHMQEEEPLEGEEGGQGGRSGEERTAVELEAVEVRRAWEELEMNEQRGPDRGQEPWWDEGAGRGMGSVAQGSAEEEVALRYGEQVVDVSPEAHR